MFVWEFYTTIVAWKHTIISSFKVKIIDNANINKKKDNNTVGGASKNVQKDHLH